MGLATSCHTGHAWVAADLNANPQVTRATNEAAEMSAAEDGSQPIPALLAYSDGSVTANGALGSAAAILRIGTHDVSAVLWLASADAALSSGRSEWTGLLLVLYIAKHVRGDHAVRLGNLKVVNAFTDGPWRFRRNWLRRNDRDLASLAWRLANDRCIHRQMAGLDSTTVLHQLEHPEKRKRPEQFDTHEVYNSKVDALTHQLSDTMALYVSFRRALRGHTTVWYEPLEEENVGHGGCHEVTGDVYKHITASAQRRFSIERVGVKDGAFLATFGKGAIGRARSESRSTFVFKLIREHLVTEARQEMWAGQTTGSATCGCGCVLSWAAPEDVSRLQWHMLECGLPGERTIRTRWHVAVRSAPSKRIKHRDVIDGIMACWATAAGRIHTAAGATRAAAGVRRRWSRRRTPAAGPRTLPPRRRALARPRADPGRVAAQRPSRTATTST